MFSQIFGQHYWIFMIVQSMSFYFKYNLQISSKLKLAYNFIYINNIFKNISMSKNQAIF